MKKENLNITRYKIDKNKKQYYIYVMEDIDTNIQENVITFYIERIGYGDMYHLVGILKKEKPENLEELITNNLEEWIDYCDSQIVE